MCECKNRVDINPASSCKNTFTRIPEKEAGNWEQKKSGGTGTRNVNLYPPLFGLLSLEYIQTPGLPDCENVFLDAVFIGNDDSTMRYINYQGVKEMSCTIAVVWIPYKLPKYLTPRKHMFFQMCHPEWREARMTFSHEQRLITLIMGV